MGKIKKFKINENITNDEIEKIEEAITPSLSFCEKCKNSNIRATKDTLIETIFMLKAIADELDIIYESYEEVKNELIEWINQKRKERDILLTKKLKNLELKSLHLKENS